MLGEQGEAEDDPLELEELHSFLPHLRERGIVSRDELHAFFRRRQAAAADDRKPGKVNRNTPQRAGREAPPRDARDVRCANCGKLGHGAQDCPSPKKELKDRPCWECGQEGYIASKCPHKKKGAQARVLQDVPPVVDFNLFETVQPSAKANTLRSAKEAISSTRPRPRGTTFGEYVESAFMKLARVQAHEEPESDDAEVESSGTSSSPHNNK